MLASVLPLMLYWRRLETIARAYDSRAAACVPHGCASMLARPELARALAARPCGASVRLAVPKSDPLWPDDCARSAGARPSGRPISEPHPASRDGAATASVPTLRHVG